MILKEQINSKLQFLQVKYRKDKDNCQESDGEEEYELTEDEVIADFNDGFLLFNGKFSLIIPAQRVAVGI